MRRTVPSALALVLVLAACGGPDAPDDTDTTSPTVEPPPSPTTEPDTTPDPSPTDHTTPDPSPSPTDDDTAAPLDECAADRFTIEYPAGWETNDPDGLVAPCRVFHPDPIDLPDEPQDIDLHWAVTVFVDAVPFEDVVGATTGEVLEERSTTVDGRDAVVTEVRGDGTGLLPDGERQYGWAVDLDGETLFARTTTVGTTEYDRDRQVLDRMMGTLSVPDVEPLAGPASTDRRTASHTGGPVVLTDVTVTSFSTFDRLTLAVGGDGEAGWDVAYEEDPRSQGSGAPVEVAGSATLRVTLTGVPLPPDAPVAPYDGPERLQPTSADVLLEVLDDTVYEGRHDLFVGVDRERPFRMGRRGDAVVVEVTHE